MKRSTLYMLLGSAVLFALASWLDLKQTARFHDPCFHALTIQDYLKKEYLTLEMQLGTIDWDSLIPLSEQAREKVSPRSWESLKDLNTLESSIQLYRDSQLVFWSGKTFAGTDSIRKQLLEEQRPILFPGSTPTLLHLEKGRITAHGNPLDILYIFPLKNAFGGLIDAERVLEYLTLSDTGSGCAVLFPEKEPILWVELTYNNAQLPFQQSLWISFLYLIAVILLLLFLNGLALYISRKTTPLIGTGSLVVSLSTLRYLSLQYGWSERFYGTFLFEKTIQSSYIGHSLGDLMINVLLVIWVMIFFHRQFAVTRFRQIPLPAKWALSILNYFTIVVAILWITNSLRELVLQSDFNVNFQNIFLLDSYGLLTLSVVVLLLFALFLFTHRLMLNIARIKLSLGQRLATMMIAIAGGVSILWFGQYPIPGLEIMLFIFFYIMLFDVFIDSHRNSFTWMVIWLVVFAGFSSVLLYTFNNDKDDQLQLEYARELASATDSLVLLRFDSLQRIASQYLDKPGADSTPQEIIQNIYRRDAYLYSHYSLDSINPRPEPVSDLVENASDTLSTIRYGVVIPAPMDSTLMYHCIFSRKKEPYTGLLNGIRQPKAFRGLERLGQYQYAVYHRGSRIDGNTREYAKLLNLDSLPNPGQAVVFPKRQQKEVIYRSADGNYVSIIGKENRGSVRPLSLFSYIFGLLVFVVLIFTLLNTFVNAFPESFILSVRRLPTLRNRIQLSVIAIIVLTFLVIGVVTTMYIRNSSSTYRDTRFEALSRSVLKDVEWSINEAPRSIGLQELLDRTSKVHGVDLEIYGLSGNLIATTMPAVYDLQYLSDKVDPVALWSLVNLGRSSYVSESSISGIPYSNNYSSIKDLSGNVLAILSIPYLHDLSDIQRDQATFMGTLMNAYVFLLLIAGIITIIVANWITRRLAIIGEKLKQVKLGKPNQPLEWKVKDEIGDLVSEYNRMIREIEESARALARSEREGAWREMAMQVAHEIKNPLTPMKLSIQHLQRAYLADPEKAKPQVEKVTDTLIKQIDHLAHIASEFSNFAKLPAARKQAIDLNAVLESIYNLHKDSPHMDIFLDLPDGPVQILGDEDHIRQVLTNLVINARQSIPEDRKGHIVIRLRRDKSTALIEVEDNGTGIPEDLLEKVFMPYFTTKHSGSGLGLAIAKNILEAMHGNISFETKWQEGTVFRIRLPLINT